MLTQPSLGHDCVASVLPIALNPDGARYRSCFTGQAFTRFLSMLRCGMEQYAKTDEPHGRFLGMSTRGWAGIWLLVNLIVFLRPTVRLKVIEVSPSGARMLIAVNHFLESAMFAFSLLALACAFLLLFQPRSRVIWVCSFLLLLAEECVRWLYQVAPRWGMDSLDAFFK